MGEEVLSSLMSNTQNNTWKSSSNLFIKNYSIQKTFENQKNLTLLSTIQNKCRVIKNLRPEKSSLELTMFVPINYKSGLPNMMLNVTLHITTWCFWSYINVLLTRRIWRVSQYFLWRGIQTNPAGKIIWPIIYNY